MGALRFALVLPSVSIFLICVPKVVKWGHPCPMDTFLDINCHSFLFNVYFEFLHERSCVCKVTSGSEWNPSCKITLPIIKIIIKCSFASYKEENWLKITDWLQLYFKNALKKIIISTKKKKIHIMVQDYSYISPLK